MKAAKRDRIPSTSKESNPAAMPISLRVDSWPARFSRLGKKAARGPGRAEKA
jgi:hypothetical protein